MLQCLDPVSLTVHLSRFARPFSPRRHHEDLANRVLSRLRHSSQALFFSGLFCASVTAGAGQATAQVPQLGGISPQQILEILQQRPELFDQIQRNLQSSGMSPTDIRGQLQAAGIRASALDAFLSGEANAAAITPSQEMVQAISLLGLAQFTRQDTLLILGDTVAVRIRSDSLRADSLAREDSLARATGRLSLFGLSATRQATTQFQPLILGPVDDNYLLGPGDILVLILTGAVELAHTIEVTREGFVFIPRVGRVFANNLTLGQLRSVLYDRLGRVYSGVTRSPNSRTQFDVTVTHPRINTIRVVGDVPRPGSYQLGATGSVLSALYQAGGLTERSNFRSIEVRRGTVLVATVDVYDYLLSGIVRNDVPLQSGDVVFVPIRGPRARITGEVTRPAIYELKPGEGLRRLVQMAGGLTPFAATEAVTISRVLPPDQRPAPGRARSVVTVDLGVALDSTGPEIPIVAGDSITVFSIQGPTRNAVTIRGAVWQPGTYSLERSARLSDLFAVAGGLRSDSYGGRVQILRTFQDQTTRLIGVALDADGTPSGGDNLTLQEFDQVTVYAETSFRSARQVTVHGAVRNPGAYAFADSMTLRDAVLMAGGLTDDADLTVAEVARLAPEPVSDGDSLAVVLRIPLDSSFIVDETGYVRRRTGTRNAPNIRLNPYDQVFLRRQPGWRPQANVTISGEVRYPGRYTLLTKDERISSVIRRAGGFTPQAYPNGATFHRQEGSAGRIGIDLPRVVRDPSFRDNLVLIADDSIHVPSLNPVVRVEGAVYAPASVAYRPGAGVGHYVEAAGGYTRAADKSRVYVEQPSGIIQNGERPEPGAVIVVPQKPAGVGGIPFATLLPSLVQILAATATLVIALGR